MREGSMMRSAGEVRGEDGATAGWRGGEVEGGAGEASRLARDEETQKIEE